MRYIVLSMCSDNDECTLGTHNCSQQCHNLPGSFECSCTEGYELEADLVTCTDIDECNLGLCSQICENQNGSFLCSCNDGYELQEDGKTCTG